MSVAIPRACLLASLLCTWMGACGSSGTTTVHDDPWPDPEPEPAAPLEVFFDHGAQRAGEGENPIVLEWEMAMTNFSTRGDLLQVRRDRTAVHTRVADRADEAFEHRGEIPTAAWEQALAVLREHHVCALRPQREAEHEEPQGVLALDVTDLRCRVILPAGEWHAQTDGRAARAATDGLMTALAPPAP